MSVLCKLGLFLLLNFISVYACFVVFVFFFFLVVAVVLFYLTKQITKLRLYIVGLILIMDEIFGNFFSVVRVHLTLARITKAVKRTSHF